jgi:glucose/arabinose dehydrogenase
LFLPGRAHEFLLLDKQGRVRWYELDGGDAALLGKFQLLNVEGGDDCGAVSLALDPLFDEHPYLYIGHCITGQRSGVTRVNLSFSDFEHAPETARRIIELGDARAQRPWHNVGSIGFDDDSVLWALFGEKTIAENAQDLGVGLGKLVRVIPNRDELSGGFEPAAGNFASALDPSVYALGLRSPWKGARDRRGHYFVADVGASDFEEINLIDEPGDNLGWPLSEGPCADDCDGLTEPLVSYGRSADERYAAEDPETRPSNGRAIWIAGPFASIADNDPYACNLDGTMLFGDFFTGWVRALRADDQGAVEVDQSVGHLVFVSTAAQDEMGFVYLTTFGNYKGHGTETRGRLYRAVVRP